MEAKDVLVAVDMAAVDKTNAASMFTEQKQIFSHHSDVRLFWDVQYCWSLQWKAVVISTTQDEEELVVVTWNCTFLIVIELRMSTITVLETQSGNMKQIDFIFRILQRRGY